MPPVSSNRLDSNAIQKALDSMKDKEDRYFQIGTHADRINVQRIEAGSFVVRPESIRNTIESIGTSKQVADDLLRQGKGIVASEEREGGRGRRSLAEKLNEIKPLAESQKAMQSPLKAQNRAGER